MHTHNLSRDRHLHYQVLEENDKVDYSFFCYGDNHTVVLLTDVELFHHITYLESVISLSWSVSDEILQRFQKNISIWQLLWLVE